jgi:peptidoglycan hydrolase-like protein with peptidoglycan-binding domain
MYTTRRVLPDSQAAVRKQLGLIKSRVAQDGPLAIDQRGSAVKALESHLRAAGLFTGKADGEFDAETKRAVQALQKHAHLAATGEVDAKTSAAVRKIDRFVDEGFKQRAVEGERGTDILRAERQLRKLGYRHLKADGVFTHNTTKELRRLQRAYGLKASGDLTAGTAKLMKRLGTTRRALGYVNGVPRKITVTPVGNGEFMRTDAARSFLKMQAAAKRAGVSLSATSGFRTMAEQKRLYALWLAGKGNLAARPGFSNHQGGIAMDVGGVGGFSTRAYSWLSHNAKKFGFVNDVPGEFWHWTYKR